MGGGRYPVGAGFDQKTHEPNLKNAFALALRAALTLGLKYVLLLDVFTQGFTLISSTRVLGRSGALNLAVVPIAHV